MEDGTQKSVRHTGDTDPHAACGVHGTLEHIGDKWSLLVILMLRPGTRRFMELRRDIGPISQRMLTRTLRRLETDGLVERTVYPVVPPRVDYSLTPLGQTLLDATLPLVDWAVAHHAEITAAQSRSAATAGA